MSSSSAHLAEVSHPLFPRLGSRRTLVTMTKTSRIISVSVPVTDLDEALPFYTETLGCTINYDAEPMPGSRIVEVVPPGSEVAIVLIPQGSKTPTAIRLGTSDAEEAHARIAASGVTVHNPEVLRWESVPPMFSFTDPDGNGLVYLEDE